MIYLKLAYIVENVPAVNGIRITVEKFLNYYISIRCAQQRGEISQWSPFEAIPSEIIALLSF